MTSDSKGSGACCWPERPVPAPGHGRLARRGTGLLLVAAFGWLLGMGDGLAAGRPARSSGGSIAFLRLSEGFWQLWVTEADGSGPRALTRTRVDKVHVTWRPGSAEVLYHTNRGESFLLDTKGGAERKVLSGLEVTDAAWSADGSRVAYSLAPDDLVHGKTTLWVSDIEAQGRRKVAGGVVSDALAPAWLADGSLLYRQCLMASNMEVLHDFWLARPDEEGAGDIVRGDEERLKFDQTVSSTRVLAYSSPRSGTYEIWTLPLAGGTRRQVTRLGAYAGNPSWSPDGRALAFDSTRDGDVQVYRAAPDGSGLVRLTSGAPSRKPVWGPLERSAGTTPAVPAAPGPGPAGVAPAPPAQAEAPASVSSGLSVRWVSTDKSAFDPGAGEQITLHFQVSSAANVSVRLLDPDDAVVRTLRFSTEGGDQKVAWDGRDEAGALVPAEAYVYVITAEEALDKAAAKPAGKARKPASVTYDLRGQTGGDTVWPGERRVDPVSGSAVYSLPQAARVRLILSREDSTWPVRTLLDWVPRLAGLHSEPWDGWDAGHAVKALGTPKLAPIVYAYSLPRNSVIVRGGNGPGPISRPRAGREVVPPPAPSTSNRTLHLHSLHPRRRCFDPALTLSFPDAAAASGAPVAIAGPTLMRVAVAPDQGPERATPIPRVSVFLFVDGVLRERYLVGYAPFQWLLDPAELGPGEHLVTALFSWRDDHFGVAHARVKVAERD